MFSYKPLTPKADSAPTVRTDAAPTEAQMKLAIAQTLSQPFAYNAPVIVLDFEADEDGGMTGRFRDAARPRVFSFEINGESVSYKPFKPGRMDSEEDVADWEEFSKGYAYRVDAGGRAGGKKAQCVKPTAYNCGSACINVNNNCKANATDGVSKDRIKKLNSLAKSYWKESSQKEKGSEEEKQLKDKWFNAKRKATDVSIERENQATAKKTGTKSSSKSSKTAKENQPQKTIKDINEEIKSLDEQRKGASEEDAKVLTKKMEDLTKEGSAIAKAKREELMKQSAKKMADIKVDPPKPSANSGKPRNTDLDLDAPGTSAKTKRTKKEIELEPPVSPQKRQTKLSGSQKKN